MVIFSIALVLYKENFYEDVELGTTVLPSEFQTLVNAPLKKNHLIIVLEWPWVCVLVLVPVWAFSLDWTED